MVTFRILTLLILLLAPSLQALTLRENLEHARPGDFIVTAKNKNYTLLHIHGRNAHAMTIEEITVPTARLPQSGFSWREWVRQGAPNNTCWILYTIDLTSGEIKNCFSVSKNEWMDAARNDIFLPTLLKLHFNPVPAGERRRVGYSPDHGIGNSRILWQPRMVVDGKAIPDVSFEVWRAHWPKDSSELSGKVIDIYLPQDAGKYPTYFPFWLQVKGMVGKATLRVVDSGSNLISPTKKEERASIQIPKVQENQER